MSDAEKRANNFIRQIVEEDLKSGKHSAIRTRFPPEPNGYLHIGHSKSICLNFGIAKDFKGLCNLRFDDTNPDKEEEEYAQAIQEDIRWLGFDWEDRLFHASDYFDFLYECAVDLIKRNKAYVCSLSPEKIKETRGSLTEPGQESPHRNRSVEENLKLFEEMKNGKFDAGEQVLRAKIDMASPNINLRDPTIYRVKKSPHPRSGDKWCLYPMYDYTHCLSDALEKITHSLCTLEFEDHRPLYDWFLEQLKDKLPAIPRQIEFARLKINYTVLSKRKLIQLVEKNHVEGWDDPRLHTIRAFRRRGYTPTSIRKFCEEIGVTKKNSTLDMGQLENCLRQDLNENAPRAMAVLEPLKVVITNYPEGESEILEAPVHPQKPELGNRKIPFSREIYIDREDFMEVPEKKFRRLAPGAAVRLRYAYIIDCEEVIKNESGEITELRCRFDKDTKSGTGTSERKVKGVIHWVDAKDSLPAVVRLYDRLFLEENPDRKDEGKTFLDYINPQSLEQKKEARVEKSLQDCPPEQSFQFERLGYFVSDRVEHKKGSPVFNRSVGLRDVWQKK